MLFLIDAWSNKKNKAHVVIMVGMPTCPFLEGQGEKKKGLGIKPCRNQAGARFVRSGFGAIQVLSQLQVEAGTSVTRQQKILVHPVRLELSNLVPRKT